jgi:hypothetical protein
MPAREYNYTQEKFKTRADSLQRKKHQRPGRVNNEVSVQLKEDETAIPETLGQLNLTSVNLT